MGRPPNGASTITAPSRHADDPGFAKKLVDAPLCRARYVRICHRCTPFSSVPTDGHRRLARSELTRQAGRNARREIGLRPVIRRPQHQADEQAAAGDRPEHEAQPGDAARAGDAGPALDHVRRHPDGAAHLRRYERPPPARAGRPKLPWPIGRVASPDRVRRRARTPRPRQRAVVTKNAGAAQHPGVDPSVSTHYHRRELLFRRWTPIGPTLDPVTNDRLRPRSHSGPIPVSSSCRGVRGRPAVPASWLIVAPPC